jgi:hypothetical protein
MNLFSDNTFIKYHPEDANVSISNQEMVDIYCIHRAKNKNTSSVQCFNSRKIF